MSKETASFRYHPECDVYMKETECFCCGSTDLEERSPKAIDQTAPGDIAATLGNGAIDLSRVVLHPEN